MSETTGGLPTTTDTSTDIPVKSSTRVGKYNFPSVSGDAKLSASILEQMEELYRKKQAEGRGLLSGLQDAAAMSMAARPGGSSAYLQQREQQKADRAAELFNIRSQIEQYKAAQEAQKRFETERGDILGITPTGTPAAASAGAPKIQLSEEEKLVLGRARTREDFNKILNQIVMERSKAIAQPSAQETKYEVRYYDDKGGVVFDVVDLPTKQRLERSGRLVDVAKPRPGPAPTTPPPAAQPPAKPTAQQMSGQFMFEDLSPEMITNVSGKMRAMDKDFNVDYVFNSPGAAERFNSLPLEKRQSFFKAASETAPQVVKTSAELPAPLEKPTAEAPAMEPTEVAQAGRIPTIPELRAQQEVEKQTRLEEAKEQAKQFQQFLTSIDAPVAVDRASTAQEIIDLTMKNPRMVGLLQKQGVGPAIAELLISGISAPGGHSIGMKQLEEALVRAIPGTTKQDLEDRDRLRTLLEKTAFHLSNIIKGQGQVTEFERVLLQQVAGSIRSAPGNLVKIQQGLLERAKLDQKLGEMYNRMGLSYGEFKKTKEYQGAIKAYENKLKDIRDSVINIPGAGGKQGAPAAPQPFSDPAKEKEYQEWKKRQLQKGKK